MANHLHIVLFPFLSPGHMIPTLDIARLLAARNVNTTIITTHVNAPTFTKVIEEDNKNENSSLINVEIFKFPTQEVGLPEGCENGDLVIKWPKMVPNFYRACDLLQEQLEEYLRRVQPECLIADFFYPWATESAAKFNIPRLVFHGISYFALCAQEIVRLYEPYKNVSSDDEPFVLPLMPHEVKLVRSQINPDLMDGNNKSIAKRMELMKKSEAESFGVIVNSFYELEPEYAKLFKDMGRKAWHIGPVSSVRIGKRISIDEDESLTWLDSKKPNSVIYVCFGSMRLSSDAPQLYEIAAALERSGKNFIWVVRNDNKELLPGFEERTKDKGLIIRGWAPQVLILEHEAVGAFVTHCGWNSTLEGILAGVPMVTWPLSAEQFYNKKLVTEVCRTGVSVGVKKFSRLDSVDDVINKDVIEKAIREIMEGDDAEEMRRRSKQLKAMAAKAVEEGGSSYTDMTMLIHELRGFHSQI